MRRQPVYKSSFANQLQGCNAVHILCGLLCLALACSQFSNLELENYQQIDFRLLNCIHVVTGAVGIHMVLHNYGSIAAKALYLVSTVLGAFTAIFYGATLIQVVDAYNDYEELSELSGGESFDLQVRFHIGKIILCAGLILIGLIEVCIGLISILFLNRLASDTQSTMRHRTLKNRGRICFVATVKVVFGIGVFALGVYLEYVYIKKEKYVKIGWEGLVTLFVMVSGLVDIFALYSERHNLLNLKVSLVFSTVTAVLLLKTLDFMMSSFFLQDVSAYTNDRHPLTFSGGTLMDPGQIGSSLTAEERDQTAKAQRRQDLIKFVVHASIIGGLVLLYFQCVISAIETGSLLERSQSFSIGEELVTPIDGIPVPWKLQRKRNCLGAIQSLCGVVLVALCVISLVPWEFSAGYTGGPGLLWVGLLFVTSGCVSAGRLKTFSTAVYLTAVISAVVALENFCFSVNEICQSAGNILKHDSASSDEYTGRIVLHCVQGSVLFVEFLAATVTAISMAGVIREMPLSGRGTPNASRHYWLAFFHFVYAIVATGIHIVAEVGIWAYSAAPIPNSFVKLTNGPVVFAAAVVQVYATQNPQFLLPSTVLQTVCAAIAFFILAPITTNLYHLYAILDQLYNPFYQSFGGSDEQDHKLATEIALGLTAAALVAAMIELVVAVISAVYGSYLIHHSYTWSTGGDGRFSTVRSRLSRYHQMGGASSAASARSRRRTRRSMDSIAITNNPQYPERYFGNDFRTYTERMYTPNGVVFKTTQSGLPSYGYVTQNGRRSSSAQTNVRHVFHADGGHATPHHRDQ